MAFHKPNRRTGYELAAINNRTKERIFVCLIRGSQSRRIIANTLLTTLPSGQTRLDRVSEMTYQKPEQWKWSKQSAEGCTAGEVDQIHWPHWSRWTRKARRVQSMTKAMTTVTTADADQWQPEFSRWRHGGWYVDNLRYPSRAVGCVSRNYPDGKRRIVCDPRPFESRPTFANRTAAAHGERELINGNQ